MHQMFQVAFSSVFRSGVRFGAALLLLAALLSACSQSPQSLADYIAAICAKPFRSAPNAEMPYLTENIDAMTKMMIGMGIRPSGDVDKDFVAMMTPHHQGAIEMAQAELRYGHNEQLKRLAQEIIVTQQQEIAAMRLAVGDSLPPSDPSPTVPTLLGAATAR
jgi:uncharacterized protein (DUF305 family)